MGHDFLLQHVLYCFLPYELHIFLLKGWSVSLPTVDYPILYKIVVLSITMEGLKEEGAEKHHLVMGDFELEAKRRNLTDSHAPEEHTPSFLPFKRWVKSFRAKKSYSPCQRLRYVEGWSDTTQAHCENTNALPCGGGQDLQWECLSGHSSNLETIKTSTLSVASQSVVRSRGTTQSTNRSFGSDLRGSIESLRPALSPSIDEEAHNRAVKRRKVLREIITTESDYVFGLKALINVYLALASRVRLETD